MLSQPTVGIMQPCTGGWKFNTSGPCPGLLATAFAQGLGECSMRSTVSSARGPGFLEKYIRQKQKKDVHFKFTPELWFLARQARYRHLGWQIRSPATMKRKSCSWLLGVTMIEMQC